MSCYKKKNKKQWVISADFVRVQGSVNSSDSLALKLPSSENIYLKKNSQTIQRCSYHLCLFGNLIVYVYLNFCIRLWKKKFITSTGKREIKERRRKEIKKEKERKILLKRTPIDILWFTSIYFVTVGRSFELNLFVWPSAHLKGDTNSRQHNIKNTIKHTL